MDGPTLALSNVATAAGPATNVTPIGSPLAAVLLNPLSVATVVPSKILSAAGNSNICWFRVAPRVSVNFGRKSVGVA